MAPSNHIYNTPNADPVYIRDQSSMQKCYHECQGWISTCKSNIFFRIFQSAPLAYTPVRHSYDLCMLIYSAYIYSVRNSLSTFLHHFYILFILWYFTKNAYCNKNEFQNKKLLIEIWICPFRFCNQDIPWELGQCQGCWCSPPASSSPWRIFQLPASSRFGEITEYVNIFSVS